MKKQLFIFFSATILAIVSSCTSADEDIIAEKNIENIENLESQDHITIPITDSIKKFGAYNALGYGYNVTGEFADANSTALKIIDTDKFKIENPSRISDETVLSQEQKDEYGKDATSFSEMISKKVEATKLLQVYGKTIPFASAKLNNQTFDKSYIYGSYNMIIKLKRFRYNATAELLSNYLTSNFLNDIEEKTPEQIVQNYGTHVSVDIYTGAKVDMIFQAKTTNHDRERAARIGVRTYLNDVNNNEIDAIEAAKNYEKKLYYKTRGGDQSKAKAGIFNLDKKTPTINFIHWQSTVTKENSVLVDFGDSGLVIIYDLVKDPVKKAKLKFYIDNYLIQNQVTLAP